MLLPNQLQVLSTWAKDQRSEGKILPPWHAVACCGMLLHAATHLVYGAYPFHMHPVVAKQQKSLPWNMSRLRRKSPLPGHMFSLFLLLQVIFLIHIHNGQGTQCVIAHDKALQGQDMTQQTESLYMACRAATPNETARHNKVGKSVDFAFNDCPLQTVRCAPSGLLVSLLRFVLST